MSGKHGNGGAQMRITDKIENIANIQNLDKVKGKEMKGKPEAVGAKDQVTVSERAKEIGRLQAEVNNIPDVRQQRIEEIKNAINAGTYNVKGEAVAGKILKEIVIDSIVRKTD